MRLNINYTDAELQLYVISCPVSELPNSIYNPTYGAIGINPTFGGEVSVVSY